MCHWKKHCTYSAILICMCACVYSDTQGLGRAILSSQTHNVYLVETCDDPIYDLISQYPSWAYGLVLFQMPEVLSAFGTVSLPSLYSVLSLFILFYFRDFEKEYQISQTAVIIPSLVRILFTWLLAVIQACNQMNKRKRYKPTTRRAFFLSHPMDKWVFTESAVLDGNVLKSSQQKDTL